MRISSQAFCSQAAPREPQVRAIRTLAGDCAARLGRVALLGAFVLLLPLTAAKAEEAKYAAFVVDANSGKVLHESNADKTRYPASLTKIMTLYMLFDQIKAGQMTLDTQMRVSAHAASRQPSKLYLKEGETIAVRDAIQALVTKSANDVATAVAEHIGGSERAFGDRMTARAREIGMSRTVFRNASGLPDSAQTTTARDMATLGLRMIDDHPKLYAYFKTKTYTRAGKTFRNHNGLLFNFEGTDGIKTGYIRASGFNLVASVRRDGKHVIGVVMGGKSSSARNTTMRSLLRPALERASRSKTRKPGEAPSAPEAPSFFPSSIADLLAMAQPHEVHPGFEGRTAASGLGIGGDTWGRGRSNSAAFAPVAPPKREVAGGSEAAPGAAAGSLSTKSNAPQQPAKSPSATGQRQPKLAANANEIIVPWPTAANPPNGQQRATGTGTVAPTQSWQATTRQISGNHIGSVGEIAPGPYHVQVGAYIRPGDATTMLNQISKEAGDLLGGHPGVTLSHEANNRRWYRARFAGFEQAAASATCGALKKRKFDCIVVPAN